MKRIKFTILLFLLIVFVVNICNATLNNKKEFLIALEMSDYTYREHNVKIYCPHRIGVYLEYFSSPTLSKIIDYFFDFQFHFTYGTVNYDGVILEDSYKVDCINDFYFEQHILLGLIYCINNNFEILPYSGIGLRYLLNEFGEVPHGYDRESIYFYLPLGFDLKYKYNKDLIFSINAEYDHLIFGWQKTFIIYPSIVNYQHDGMGLKFSIKAEKICKNYSFFAGPFFKYWNIDESDRVRISNTSGESITVFEPKNNTKEIGIQFGLKFN
jgi:hypothetical protein